MAEPTIVLQLNENTEAAPTWVTIVTAARWVGPDASVGDLSDPFPAGVIDADDAFFDNAAAPDDGELWHDQSTDSQVIAAGRALNQNTLRTLETGGSDPTADPPELTAYDDATDAGNRTEPTVAILAGTAGSSNISFIRAFESTAAAPAAGWGTQVHDTEPTIGSSLDGDTNVEAAATILAASGNKTWQLCACAPHDSPTGVKTFVYSLQYTWT